MTGSFSQVPGWLCPECILVHPVPQPLAPESLASLMQTPHCHLLSWGTLDLLVPLHKIFPWPSHSPQTCSEPHCYIVLKMTLTSYLSSALFFFLLHIY